MQWDENNGPALPGISVATPEQVVHIANGVVLRLPPLTQRWTFLVGSDTTLPARSLAEVVQGCLTRGGLCVHSLGAVPLPAVSQHLARLHVDEEDEEQGDGAIHVSFRGGACDEVWLTLLGRRGVPLSRRACSQIAAAAGNQASWPPLWYIGRASGRRNVLSAYRASLAGAVSATLQGELVIVDAQNGTASDIVPLVLQELGAVPAPVNCSPDGASPGGPDLGRLSAQVRQSGACGAVIIDLAGTRVRVLDRRGEVVGADRLLAFLARHLLPRTDVANRIVVGPSPASHELEETLDSLRCRLVPVSRSCADLPTEMHRHGAVLGSDAEGRFVLAQHSPVPDGCFAAVQAAAMLASNE